MASYFFDRTYEVFLVLGGPHSQPLWEFHRWQPFADKLAPFTVGPRGKASVRTLQYAASGKALPFGRLGWDIKSHQKWTFPVEPAPDGRPRFIDAQAWSPSWTVCLRENLAPDFFFDVVNERSICGGGQNLLFNQRIVCAIASENQQEEKVSALRSIFQSLASDLSAPIFARTSRQWGVSMGGGGFTFAIQELALLNLFKVGDPHTRKLDESTFKDVWELIFERDASPGRG